MSLAQANSHLRMLIERNAEHKIRNLEALSKESNIKTEFSTLQSVNPLGFLYARMVCKCLNHRKRSNTDIAFYVTERVIEQAYEQVVKEGMMVNIPMPYRNDTTIRETLAQPTVLGRDAYHWEKKYNYQDYMVGCGPKADQAFVIRIHSGSFTPFFFLPPGWDVHAKNVEWNRNICIIQFVRMYSTHIENRHLSFLDRRFPVQPTNILVMDMERWVGHPLNVAFYIRRLIWPSIWKQLREKKSILPNDFSPQGERLYRDVLGIPGVIEIKIEPKLERVTTSEGRHIPEGCIFWLEIEGSNDYFHIKLSTRIGFKPDTEGTLPTRKIHVMRPRQLFIRNLQGELIHEFNFDR